MKQAEHKIEKFNEASGHYENGVINKISEDDADSIVAFLADAIDVEQFYKHTITYSDGRNAVKFTSYNDVQGMVKAMALPKKQPVTNDTETKDHNPGNA